MEYATLGNTGLLVSKLCFGTMTCGAGTVSKCSYFMLTNVNA
jgi:aryl-alcohol dehydrogenase-like predicted oxidoreductase